MSRRSEKNVIEALDKLSTGINVLFEIPVDGELQSGGIADKDFIVLLTNALAALRKDIEDLKENPDTSSRLVRKISPEPDSIDYLNCLGKLNSKSLAENIDAAVLDMLTALGVFTNELNADECAYYLDWAFSICESTAVFNDWVKLLEKNCGQSEMTRIIPTTRRALAAKTCLKRTENSSDADIIMALGEQAIQSDPFQQDRAFRYAKDKFHPARLTTIRRTADFYGYTVIRDIFQRHFEAFVSGKENLPLLISSLPGMGKTHFSIAYTLESKELTLILPEPEMLENELEALLNRLAARKNRKFVLFFDDVNVDEINWYYFRTNIGGSYTLPANVNVIIASNNKFPANITSRGRNIEFPIFDDLRCMDMIEEFLRKKGMKKPPPNLISVIAADYVCDYSRRIYDELSPRTLIRYLDKYNADIKLRKRALEMSQEKVIIKPDPEVFFKFNVKVIKSLHGEEAIEQLRDEILNRELS